VAGVEGTRSLLPKSVGPLAAVLAGALMVLCGCQFTVHGPTAVTPSTTPAGHVVPKNAVEQVTAERVRDQLKGNPLVVTCPRDLPITLGATEDCVMAQDGKKYPIKVTVTKVNGPDDAHWDWEVGHEMATS
jgi:hypothetical protein